MIMKLSKQALKSLTRIEQMLEKHLQGEHNQMSHGGGGDLAADTGGNTSGGGGGGGEVYDWKKLDRNAAKAEGFDAESGSFFGGEKLKGDLSYVDKRMGELEDSGQDDSREWKALSMMQTALYIHTSIPLSKKQWQRTAVAYEDGKIVAAGTMRDDRTNGHISHIGATKKGAGKYVVASLIRQARDKKLKTMTADASPDAFRLLSKFGFERAGRDGDDGTPMKLRLK